MTPERWQRVEGILNSALDRCASDRAAFVAEACGEDQELRIEVESLLSFDATDGRTFSNVVAGAAAGFASDWSRLPAGERIGVYRIIREIGRGGMGTVYLAERDDHEFKKQVAIKLVTRGMDTAALLQRFRNERQILARLDHPYIARLLDGGSTADNRPYLVMEYVVGRPITSYCREQGLGIHARVELFRKVCTAVQSAHQKLVVHRDLKPGNILVDMDGSPKLLDFGIAKLLGAEEEQQTTMQMDGVRILTPDYSSPEQVRGEAITTAADVYALGAILYEILCGRGPHQFRSLTPMEIERIICQVEPEKPSAVSRKVSSRSGDSRTPLLEAGDLDNILLMALQKEPARRYGSVGEFSEDLRRYLEGLPVRAREDKISYRIGKFVLRHRAGVAAAVLLVASLAGGVTVSTIQARRAERRFAEVRGIAHAVLYDIYDAIRDLQGSVKARDVVVRTALEYLNRLEHEAGGDPGIQLELAEAYQRVGDVQGNPVERSLGKTADALVSYRKAMAIADELAATHPASVKANLIRMSMCHKLGDVSAQSGNIGEALALYEKGTRIGESIAVQDPSNRENLSALSQLYIVIAREQFNTERSIASARKGLAIVERLSAARPADEDALLDLSDGYSTLGTMLLRGNQLEEASAQLFKAMAIREKLVAAHPVNARYKRQLMISYSKAGDVLGPIMPSLDDPAGALENYRKMLALAETMAAADPADKAAAYDRGMALMKTGNAFPERDNEKATAMLSQALQVFDSLARSEPGSKRLRGSTASAYLYMGRRLARSGDNDGAMRSYREAMRIEEDLIARDPKDLSAMRGLSISSQALAIALAAKRERSAAIELSRKGIAVAGAARGIDATNSVTQAWLPQAYGSAGAVYVALAGMPGNPTAQRREDLRQARELYQSSAAAWEKIQPQGGWPKDRDAQLAHAKAEASRCAGAMGSVH